jgi:hypothetical protein
MADVVKEALVSHVLKVGNSKIVIQELLTTYKDIGSVVGITEKADTDKVDDIGSISKLKQAAKVITFNVRMSDKKTHKVNCSIDKASSAPANLIGKSISGATIKKVSVPRRRSRR